MNTPESRQKQANPYYPAFDLFLAQLLATEQALRLSEAVFCQASGSTNDWLSQIPEAEIPAVIADICDEKVLKYKPSFREPYRTTGFLIAAVRNLQTQSYLWAIARGFERFREFVVSLASNLVDAAEADAEGDPTSGDRTEKVSPSGFDAAIKRIRKIAPSLSRCEKRNAGKIQLQQWIRVVEQVRHAVAHNEGVLREEIYTKCSDSGLEQHFPGRLEPGTGYVLMPTSETSARALRTLREYGLAIYKTISEAKGIPATLVGRDGEITTWNR